MKLTARRRRPVLVLAAILVAGPPTAFLLLQWSAALAAVVRPETTCWIAGTEGHFLFVTEIVPLLFATVVAVWWAPASIAALVLARLFSVFRLRFALITIAAAIAACALLIIGTAFAVELERSAYAEVRAVC